MFPNYFSFQAKEYEVMEIRRDCKKSVANFDLVVSRLNKMSNARSNLNKSIAILKSVFILFEIIEFHIFKF